MTEMTMQNMNETEAVPQAAMAVVSRDVAFDSYKRGLEPTGIDAAYRLATALAKTNYGGGKDGTTPEQVLAKMMFGRELGLTVMNSLRSVYVVNGRPGLDANVMHALCLQSPVCEYFDLVETTAEVATYRAKRLGRPEQILSWTIKQAKTAGLFGDKGKDNWNNYPENMLRARCIANLARICFPEAINGMHTPEELETSTVPAADPVPADAAGLLQGATELQEKHAAAATALKERIAAVQTPEEKKALRADLAQLKASGELPDPWLEGVYHAYNSRFAKKAAPAPQEPTTTTTAALVANAAPAEGAVPAAHASEPTGREPGEEG